MPHNTEHHIHIEPLPHVGLRKLKSLLAIFVGFWVWQLIRLLFPSLEVHPIYIYIYGLLEMRDSSQNTVSMGKNRIKATFTAMGVGLPALLLIQFLTKWIQPQWLDTGIELAILLLGVLLALEIAEKVGCAAYCGLAAAIFIIFIISQKDGEPILYSILRASQTIIGVSIAWLINVKLFPYPGKTESDEPQGSD